MIDEIRLPRPFRDDEEATRARVEALERELREPSRPVEPTKLPSRGMLILEALLTLALVLFLITCGALDE